MSRRHTGGGNDGRRLGRRQWLSTLGVGGATALAGCSGIDGDGGGDGGDGDEASGGSGSAGGDVELGDFPRFGVGDLYGQAVARDLAARAFDRSDHEYGFDGDAMINPDGDRVEVGLVHVAGAKTNRLTAEFIARELGDNLGMSVAVDAMDSARFRDDYWLGESAEGGTDTVNGEEVEWSDPNPNNPGPRSVTSSEPWDMSVVYGLNTYPLNPSTNGVFFDGADARYNPVGYYPQFDVTGLFERARRATSRDELQRTFVEIFENLAREQPYVMLLFSADLIGYDPDLVGPSENFSNGWDSGQWHFDEPTISGSYDTVTSSGYSTLNPLYNTKDNADDAIGRALDQGYTFDENQDFFPLLYDMSTEDGDVWTFDVRENLRFSDPYGRVTAEDFVYAIRELHQTDWANTDAATDWEGVEVERTGELEFRATLPTANLLWPETYDPLMYPVPRGLVEPYVEEKDAEGLREDEALSELRFAGNLGAFRLDEWERGSGVRYTRNDEYYLRDIQEGPDLFSEAPLFEESTISVVEERASRLGALETGAADAAAVPPEQFESYTESESVTARQIPTPFNSILSVNQRDNGWNAGPGNLFRHVPFRQALSAAISRDELISGVYRDLAEPHFTWQPRWSEFYPGEE
ncbi:ABC transporter substrate-binding protein [Halorubrum yunnanense]|uniref:ABC transporter substrate-binding protein n=1 Tax=Halorubrum yunnanense TaxID=1526162 RepID=A0ABD5YEF7_9EURY|nr:ABC transporter substrate-binding protein [Halorubrum yunnanense]